MAAGLLHHAAANTGMEIGGKTVAPSNVQEPMHVKAEGLRDWLLVECQRGGVPGAVRG